MNSNGEGCLTPQNLISSVNLPYLFSSNFEIDGNLNMIRKDSSFFNFDASINLCYSKGPQNRIGIILSQNQSTNVQQLITTLLQRITLAFLMQQNQLNKILIQQMDGEFTRHYLPETNKHFLP